MPRVYTRKYHNQLDDLLYFLFEYPDLRHLLTPEERTSVEKRRQELINWVWKQMGRKEDPPLLDENLPPFGDEIRLPGKGTKAGSLLILDAYENYRAAEIGRNPGERAKALLMKEFGFKTKEAVDKYLQRARKLRAEDRKARRRCFSDDDVPF
jgi:hypothetical protein